MLTLKIAAKNFLKGGLIGIGAVIPGVSGGTVAMIIGVFEDIIESVANVFRHMSRSIIILSPIILGALFGAYLISFPLTLLNDTLPNGSKLFYYFLSFLSAILFAKLNFKGEKRILPFLVGIIFALALSIAFKETNVLNFEHSFVNLFIIGLPLALALVLPAISFSFMLLYFGIYDHFIKSINTLEMGFLIPLISGIALGSFIFSKLLLKLITKKEKETYSLIFGFIIFSIVDIMSEI